MAGAKDALPADTGDHRPITQRALREAMHMTGKEMGAQLHTRDNRLDKIEEAIRGLVKITEARR